MLGEEPQTSSTPQAQQPNPKSIAKSHPSTRKQPSAQDFERANSSKPLLQKTIASKPMMTEMSVPARAPTSTIPLSTLKPLHPAPRRSAISTAGHIARRSLALASDAVVLAVFVPVVGVMTAISAIKRWVAGR
ncbi:MAG: hypothetical protein CTY39_07710 [Hyphomicrobium sp.]|nr:MAG: hypothetical protein CTY39_07710 [Hyphomicrobium sp.]